jgi:hypothetical protein
LILGSSFSAFSHSGLFLTGVIAGIAVYAMRKALDERDKREPAPAAKSTDIRSDT